MKELSSLYKLAENFYPFSLEQAVELYTKAPLVTLMEVAQKIRYKKIPKKEVSWQIDRNVNYSNVCISGCLFCNFHCRIGEKDKEKKVTLEEYKEKIKVLKEHGGNQLLLQGGLHPKYDINYYKNLFKQLKEIEPSLKLNALGPPEIAHIARISKISYEDTLRQLIDCGLSTLPGAGAEILSDRVRKMLSPAKPSVKQWIDVMKTAHKIGLSTTATMVYGHIESVEERMQHLLTLREIQHEKPDNSPGFRAFICWPMQVKGTLLEKKFGPFNSITPADHLRMVAISRIILNNIDHIQASWLTVGVETAKLSLHAGADDMGSIMIEENVVSSAGVSNTLDKEGMVKAIKEAGFIPWLRDQQYSRVL